jgi:ribosomal protein S18 acetylase RimI-like enzyme
MSALITIVKTYLELPTFADLRPALSADPDLLLMPMHEPLPEFYRFLYRAVGAAYDWTDRNVWTDDQLRDYLSQPRISVLVLYVRGTPAGYLELEMDSDEEPGTQIVYFGLISAFHGRGYGKHLLSVGVQRAFAARPDDRVWLNTCTLDGPHALSNYKARGFMPYREVTLERRVGL